jgi:hypothetical protein
MRHADYDERDRLKDNALRAHSLYDSAEILRRYLDRYHQYPLPDETDIDRPERNESINLERYGNARPSDYERSAFRRIARQFGVDPGYRIYCFVEGVTEVEYVRRWAENVGANLDRAGVRVVCLGGKDNIAVFEDQLRRLQEEEVFAVVCVDLDHPAHSHKQAKQIKTLRRFEANGLLPIDFTVWDPNFVQHNFTIDEMLAIVNAECERQGIDFVLERTPIERHMDYEEDGAGRKHQMTLEDAVENIALRKVGKNLTPKGKSWGRLLADWAVEHPAPPEIADSDGNRPIDVICGMLLRGSNSDYPLTVQRWKEARESRSM